MITPPLRIKRDIRERQKNLKLLQNKSHESIDKLIEIIKKNSTLDFGNIAYSEDYSNI